MKRKQQFLIGIVGLSGIAIVGFILCIVILGSNPSFHGLNKISRKSDGTISIRCTDFSGVTICSTDLNEQEYRGERLTPINQDLGEFVVKIVLQDAGVAKRFQENYSSWTTYMISNSELLFMYAYTPDHGVVIYIGSNEPIDINDISIKRL